MDEEVFVDFGLDAFSEQLPKAEKKENPEVEKPEDTEIKVVEANSDPFCFEKLPSELRLNIIRKFDYTTCTALIKCSKTSKLTCSKMTKQRYLLDVTELTVTKKRLYTEGYRHSTYKYFRTYWQHYQRSKAQLHFEDIAIECPLTTERCRKIVGLFRSNGTTCDKLLINERITCDPELIQALTEVLQCIELEIEEAYTRNEILQLSAIIKLDSVTIENCSATDRELLDLSANDISLNTDHVTSRGIAKFIDQWRHGKREIDYFCIEFDATKATRTGDDMVRGMDATLEWSPETHKDSMLGSFPIESLDDIDVTYSIKRITPSTGEPQILLLHIQDDNVTASVGNPWTYLKYQVDEDDYYDATRMCQHCDTQFCEHYERFSVGQFQRAFPWIYKSIGLLITIARCSIFPLQAFYLPTTFDNAYLRIASRSYFYNQEFEMY